ncbi:uncharacterized protein L3040_002392 [Drepanopeziza brunnea f. sp. 'multigermtubi']|uniref:BZIP transcription factor n=1 Tax=Marssonina brunnea f. sp. multigermtubi (strain MB_m1) TaxID=1072389 RepID=K1X4D6_MARBU|nr:bZIP transcription factor [Drepanopeziza brunnea f. sp. 'multigermtubi' MB_m1]EKD19927.1 bZIP transcription factor [Drepanopeziza brunnea f. sp. 'multigermtubi' MB_m1]KAJ5050514.1 hypothetical protein L3040_002392 [Drepanopeziza brunnea f. sp. 'multigermtubi']
MSSQTSSSPSIPLSNSQASCHDPFDSMVDFSEYDKLSYYSPSASPAANKSQFTSRAVSNTPAALPSSSQPDLSGPSHNYAMYKQQTGIPQGAVASTLAINQMSQLGFNEGYVSGYPSDELIDFGTAPASKSTGFDDMGFDSSPSQELGYVFPEVSPGFINPQTTLPVSAAVMPAQTSNVGRLWPGMHQQQAALAKAQAHQKQQQQLIHQQQRLNGLGGPQKQRSRASTANEPFVEERISQLLESMRRGSVGSDDDSNHDHPSSHAHRQRKEAEDMDEDERLLASEEGKKLSSKERRQLRNKVSARAFRSRRKEYIGQLEGEIAVKVNENAELLHDNRALRDEVTRLSDFTRMLLSSPCFSGFLDTLASNPAAAQTAQAVLQQPQPAPVEQQPLHQRKDVNPFAGQQQMDQQQHVGMTMIPEQSIDFSLFDNIGGFSYQPQVFSVLSLPETVLDADVLSGKSSPFTPLASDDEKVELPKIERMPVSAPPKIELPVIVDEEFDADPAFALFTATTITPETESAPTEFDLSFLTHISSKPVQYELVVKTETNDASLRRVERLNRDMEACVARLTALTMHL